METTEDQLRDPVGLARATMAHIDAHPDEHMQSIWWCGTAGCFAGLMAKLHPDVKFADPVGTTLRADYVHTPDGRLLHVAAWAEEFLGLQDSSMAAGLFSSDNTADDLRQLVDVYAEAVEHGVDPVEAVQGKSYELIGERW